MIEMYNAKKYQPEDKIVVLAKLDTEIFIFAHYNHKTKKWYDHDTSSPECTGIPCPATVVSWMYLPE